MSEEQFQDMEARKASDDFNRPIPSPLPEIASEPGNQENRQKMDLNPTMDEDGYPTDETERMVREFSGDVRDLLEGIREVWYHGNYGWDEEDDVNICDRPVHRYHVSTCGWSGNESIIEALRENRLFWMLFWVQERVGGHFIFEVGPDNTTIIPWPKPAATPTPVPLEEAGQTFEGWWSFSGCYWNITNEGDSYEKAIARGAWNAACRGVK